MHNIVIKIKERQYYLQEASLQNWSTRLNVISSAE